MVNQPSSLRAVMAALRDPQTGCPWDREQDHQTLARFLREEAAEVLDVLAAHREGDPEAERHLCEELGDLWLQVVFHAQLAQERGAFDLHDVERGIVSKLVRRHPHVFAEVNVADSDEVLANWKVIKADEKAELGHTAEKRLLEAIPKSLSPLEEAMEIGRKCAKVGFEWHHIDDVLAKVHEEIGELQAESDPVRVEEEFGDVLFSLVQWARRKGIDPDRALRLQMRRFKDRFEKVEDHALAEGGWETQTLEQLDAVWVQAKKASRGEAL